MFPGGRLSSLSRVEGTEPFAIFQPDEADYMRLRICYRIRSIIYAILYAFPHRLTVDVGCRWLSGLSTGGKLYAVLRLHAVLRSLPTPLSC